MKNTRLQRLKYLIPDAFAAALAYTLLYIFRKTVIEPRAFGYKVPVTFSHEFYLGVILIPLFWLVLYYFTGYYKDVYRKSRLAEFGQTFFSTLTGTVVIFFAVILDDIVGNYHSYYQSFLVLFGFQFLLTYIPRLLVTTSTLKRIAQGKIRFNTLLIGGGPAALEVYREISGQRESTGNYFIGFLKSDADENSVLDACIPCLGRLEELDRVVTDLQVEEIIIAISTGTTGDLEKIIGTLHTVQIPIKAIPGLNDLLTGNIKLRNLFGTPLIEVSPYLIPEWQVQLKHFFDIAASLLAIILFSPLMLVLGLIIKITSRGPVLYSHERIGRYGKPFHILKFRSMYLDAEKNGPELSNRNDQRITPIGRFMRRHRLDELPNFFNVLKGDMAIVGPRPERQFYIDQILERAPHYILLQKVKPGITSWGQVKFGYAENVDQMILRLRYDLLYIENMSLTLDFKIIIYTIITIFKGRGV